MKFKKQSEKKSDVALIYISFFIHYRRMKRCVN